MRFDYQHSQFDTCPSITMKFLILSLALAAVASAQHYEHQGGSQPPIPILRQAQEANPDGSYSYNFETAHGIAASESGSLGPQNSEGQQSVVVRGQYSYTAPDGTPIVLSYIADENGFQPQGAHLPVAPAIPAEILRSLEYNAAHPEEDDSQQPQLIKQQQYNRRF